MLTHEENTKDNSIAVTNITFVLILDLFFTYKGLFGEGWDELFLYVGSLPLTIYLISMVIAFKRLLSKQSVRIFDIVIGYLACGISIIISGIYAIGLFQRFNFLLLFILILAIFSLILNISWLKVLLNNKRK